MLRATCSECPERLQRARGCGRQRKPERPVAATRFTSPLLADTVLYECPTGYVLREAPWAYDVLEAAALAENASPAEWAGLPRWYQHATRLVRSEQARLRELEAEARRAASDSRAAQGQRHG